MTVEAIKIFQCESCGKVFDKSDIDSSTGWHLGVQAVEDGRGGVEPSPCQCGPIVELRAVAEAELTAILKQNEEKDAQIAALRGALQTEKGEGS